MQTENKNFVTERWFSLCYISTRTKFGSPTATWKARQRAQAGEPSAGRWDRRILELVLPTQWALGSVKNPVAKSKVKSNRGRHIGAIAFTHTGNADTQTQTHTNKHTLTDTYNQTYTHTNRDIHTDTQTNTYAKAHTEEHIHTGIYTHVCTHARRNAHAQAHACAHAHTFPFSLL